MSVHDLPAVEPWPAEFFELFSVRDLEQLVVDAQAVIVRRKRVAAGELAACPDCAADVHPSATTCEGCGAHLPIHQFYDRGSRPHLGESESREPQEVPSMPIVHGSTCGGNDCCTACVLASYEPTVDPLPLRMMNTALDATYAALTAPHLTDVSNVVDMHGHSKKVRP